MAKTLYSPALVWSTEDLDMAVERLHESNNITDGTLTNYECLSQDQRLSILADIFDNIEGYLMEHINDLITDQFFQEFKDNLPIPDPTPTKPKFIGKNLGLV